MSRLFPAYASGGSHVHGPFLGLLRDACSCECHETVIVEVASQPASVSDSETRAELEAKIELLLSEAAHLEAEIPSDG